MNKKNVFNWKIIDIWLVLLSLNSYFGLALKLYSDYCYWNLYMVYPLYNIWCGNADGACT